MSREIDGGLWRGMRKKEERGQLGAVDEDGLPRAMAR